MEYPQISLKIISEMSARFMESEKQTTRGY